MGPSLTENDKFKVKCKKLEEELEICKNELSKVGLEKKSLILKLGQVFEEDGGKNGSGTLEKRISKLITRSKKSTSSRASEGSLKFERSKTEIGVISKKHSKINKIK